jgi:methylmalonyl-CoA mutase N-terminal domain/subunit
MERRVQEYLDKIKERGGAIACIDQGYLQREIARAAAEYQQQIEKRERIIVGVNDFVVEEPEPPAMFHVDEREEKRQRRQIKQLRAHRDNPAVERCLQRLREAVRGTDNLMPPILEAVKSYATMGEITGALADVWGRYRERPVF